MENLPKIQNITTLPVPLPNEEVFEVILQTPAILVERIISTGQVTPRGEWYDQERDEWVILIQGSAVLEYEGGGMQNLSAGDHLLLKAHRRHRVALTSMDPPCVWLAIHGTLECERL